MPLVVGMRNRVLNRRLERKVRVDGQQKGSAAEGRDGSVLMETVIAIPLFMIMLGGIFWIGDLTVTRQQLVIADRYVAWNKGLRYDDKGKIDAQPIHQLFFSDKYGAPSPEHKPTASQSSIESAYDWSHVASGQVRVRVRMPDWIYSTINAGQYAYNLTETIPEDIELRGRERSSERHVVLMRTQEEWKPGYIRNRYGIKASGEVAKRWEAIADEKWPYE